MRVIAGTAKHILLKTVEGLETRPTTDRIKETLFNMINPYLYDATFLDLYSGSGGIGIEALSRGAQSATFVENNRASLTCIKSNLEATKLMNRANILALDVMTALKNVDAKNVTFDIIFMDPPYNQDFEKEVLNYLDNSNLIHDDSIIIVEASLNTDFSYLKHSNLELYKTKEYKTNKHVFIRSKIRKETI